MISWTSVERIHAAISAVSRARRTWAGARKLWRSTTCSLSLSPRNEWLGLWYGGGSLHPRRGGLDKDGPRAFLQRSGVGHITAPHLLIGAREIKQEPER